MDNGTPNETTKVQTNKPPQEVPETPEIKNRTLSMVVNEVNNIIMTLLQNGGKITPVLEEFCKTEQIKLPEMADTYGYMQDRLKMEIGFWVLWGLGPEDEEKMITSVRAVHDAFLRRIETSMNAINLKELKGDQYLFSINVYGKLEIGLVPKPEKDKVQ